MDTFEEATMRPMLKPGIRRLWRDSTTLQLGVDPDRAVVLSGLEPPVAGILDGLDGTRSRAMILSQLSAPGRELIALLEASGLLDDATPEADDPVPRPSLDRERLGPDLASLALLAHGPSRARRLIARRREACVRVQGAGRVGAQVASLLAAAGIGLVLVDDAGIARAADVAPGGLRLDDIGRPRSVAASSAMSRVTRPTPKRRRTQVGPVQPDFVVIAPPGLPIADLDEAVELEQSGIPHLLSGVRETTGIIGPLVVAGLSSCLTCQHLHRTDRDPDWPLLVTQMARRPASGIDACDVSLSAAVASLTALQTLAWLDEAPLPGWVEDGDGMPADAPVAGAQVTAPRPAEVAATAVPASEVPATEVPATALPATLGGTIELALPNWRLRRRTWPVHSGCGCRTSSAVQSA